MPSLFANSLVASSSYLGASSARKTSISSSSSLSSFADCASAAVPSPPFSATGAADAVEIGFLPPISNFSISSRSSCFGSPRTFPYSSLSSIVQQSLCDTLTSTSKFCVKSSTCMELPCVSPPAGRSANFLDRLALYSAVSMSSPSSYTMLSSPTMMVGSANPSSFLMTRSSSIPNVHSSVLSDSDIVALRQTKQFGLGSGSVVGCR
mmetsp:Transcript_31670/g.76666  ORF Transcript_31670/g.76666 Transcript_31670/m.76666 type:complete len:207 (-) Transcript_31670:1916-2536(-)